MFCMHHNTNEHLYYSQMFIAVPDIFYFNALYVSWWFLLISLSVYFILFYFLLWKWKTQKSAHNLIFC